MTQYLMVAGGLIPMSPKRERFIAQLKQLSAKKGLKFRGDSVTTLPSREEDSETSGR